MRELYTSQFLIAKSLSSDSEQLSYLNSILRSILQTAAITTLEAVKELTPFPFSDSDIKRFINRFEQPSDGLPIEILDVLIPIIRSHVDLKYMDGWFESQQPLVKDLTLWVTFRNKKPGHGVVDKNDASIWSRQLQILIPRVLDTLGPTFPHKTDNGRLFVEIGNSSFPLNTPLVSNEKPLVILKTTSRKGIWKLHAQLLDWHSATEVTIGLDENSIFANDNGLEGEHFQYQDIDTPLGRKSLFHNIPTRQTDIFEGRRDELDTLKNWMNDVEDSRICLTFGDGGFGKTTLVLEFLNRILEGDVEELSWYPSIICYHTAKMTRWTDAGIVHLKGISDAMEDSVRELMYCLYPVLDKDWYKTSGGLLIQKAASELGQQKFNRNDVLLVIDNTETLATSPFEVKELADFLTQIGKKLGRVIITSRRREFVEAKPLEISPLTDEDAYLLIKRLGKEYKAEALNVAGDRRLRKVCKQLNNKPLLIDTLVKYIARSSTGIDDALEQILKKTNDELLEFLYQDAWLRMNELSQQVFLVLVVIAHPIDNLCIADACQEIGIPHAAFQSSLDETYFANITDRRSGYDLEIVDLAKEFFRQKLSKLQPKDKDLIKQIATKVDQQASKRERIEKEYKSDRVADAFRSQYAKAAKIASEKGNYSDARENYELALLEEPMNAALHDRYAWFLLNLQQDTESAKQYAEKAVDLDQNNADAHLTLSLINYRLGNLQAGDDAIKDAMKKGKPESLCLLRMGIARYHHSKGMLSKADKLGALDEAGKLIELATKTESQLSNYYRNKNLEEARKYQQLITTFRHFVISQKN